MMAFVSYLFFSAGLFQFAGRKLAPYHVLTSFPQGSSHSAFRSSSELKTLLTNDGTSYFLNLQQNTWTLRPFPFRAIGPY